MPIGNFEHTIRQLNQPKEVDDWSEGTRVQVTLPVGLTDQFGYCAVLKRAPTAFPWKPSADDAKTVLDGSVTPGRAVTPNTTDKYGSGFKVYVWFESGRVSADHPVKVVVGIKR